MKRGLPALQQLCVHRLLSVQQSLVLAARLALERDALLHRQVAEGVGAPTELPAGFRIVFREGRGGTWRGVARRLLILLRRIESDGEKDVSAHITVFLFFFFLDFFILMVFLMYPKMEQNNRIREEFCKFMQVPKSYNNTTFITQVTALYSPSQYIPTLIPGQTFHLTPSDAALPLACQYNSHVYCILMDNVL